jgi:cytoskeleton protein RodZ
MTDDKDRPDEETPEVKAEGPLGGERLAEARRAKQISVLEIAKELHVEESKIRALENNDFGALGAPVFAKGHLRKYSQLVGVNHDDVLADYYRLTRSEEMPPVIVKRAKPGREFSPGPWIAVFVVLVLLALAYWLLVERPFETQPVPAAAEPGETETAARTEPGAAEAETSAAEAAGTESTEPGPAEEPVVEETAAAATQPQDQPAARPAADEPQQVAATPQGQLPATERLVPPAAGDDDVRLSVTFAGDCWTEITDASGRRLFFQLGRSGRTVNVSGPGPLSVLFGDAANVELRVNGEDFTIPASARRGLTARFSIAGS